LVKGENMRFRYSIYVAGPYSDPSFMNALENMRHGIEVGAELIKLGFSVFCPFIDYQFIFFQPSLTREDYLEHSLEQVHRQDILYVLKGWQTSTGTIAEMHEAEECSIPTFFEQDTTPLALYEHYLGLYGEALNYGR
jgi:hypothetical protein